MTNNRTSGQGYRINSKQSARRVDCRADDSPSPLPHQPHQQEEAIKCSAMPHATISPGICDNIEENKSQSKVVAGTVNSEEQSQRHVYQWRNQQLMRGERPRAAVAPVCGTLPGTLVDPNRGPPPANVDDDNRPNSRQYDHLVLPYGIYCTLVALASLSLSTVFTISIIYAKMGNYFYSVSSWAADICYFVIVVLTGCAAVLHLIAILVATCDDKNRTLPILRNQMSERCEMCCTTQIGALKVAVPVLCLINFFFHGGLYLPMLEGGGGLWVAGMVVWLALSITGFAFCCCIARKE